MKHAPEPLFTLKKQGRPPGVNPFLGWVGGSVVHTVYRPPLPPVQTLEGDALGTHSRNVQGWCLN